MNPNPYTLSNDELLAILIQTARKLGGLELPYSEGADMVEEFTQTSEYLDRLRAHMVLRLEC